MINKIETFSDKPFKCGGLTIRPRWAYSTSYKKWVQKHEKARRFLTKDQRENQVLAYIDWYRDNFGVAKTNERFRRT